MATTYKLLQGKFTKKTEKGIKTFRAGVKGEDLMELDPAEIKMLGDRIKKLSAADVKKLTLTVNPAKQEQKDEELDGDDSDDEGSDDDMLKE